MADTQKMLNFKMGLLENLQALDTKTPGTIYVTTDERAMYLDVDASTRIRLGDAIIVVNKITELEGVKPWQHGAMYYATEDDVLVIYDGENSKFRLVNEKLMNQVTNISNTLAQTNIDLTNLTNKVGTVATKDDIVTVGQWLSHLDGRTTVLEGEMDTAQTDISNAKTAIESLQEDVAAITGGGTDSIKTLKEAITALQGTSAEHTTQIAGLGTRLTTAETDIDNLETADVELQKEIDAAEVRIKAIEDDYLKSTDKTTLQNNINTVANDLASEVARSTGVEAGLRTDVDTANRNASQALLDAAAAQEAADQAQDEVDAVEGRVGTVEGKVSTLEGKVSTLESSSADYATRISTVEGKVSTLEGKMTTAEGNISTLQGNVTSLQSADEALDERITTNTSNITKVTNRVSTLEGTVGGHTTSINSINETLTSLQTQITGNDTDITNLKAKDAAIEEAYKAADSALETAYKAADAQLRSDLGEANAAIAKEATDRAAAVKAEEDARKAAVSAEETARKNADADLLSQIQSNDADILELQNALGGESTSGSILARVKALESTDATHNTNIAANASKIKTLEENTIPALDTRVKTIEDTMATDSELAGVKSELEGKITTAQNAANQAQKEVDALESDVATFKITVGDTYATKTALSDEATARDAEDKALAARIAVFEANGAKDVAALMSRVDDAEDQIATNKSDIATNKSDIATNTTNINTNKQNIQSNLNAINAIKDHATVDSFADMVQFVENAIQGNDAMQFMGTIGTGNNPTPTVTTLPTNALTGDTYKVVTDNYQYSEAADKTKNAKIGDLFIALKDNPSALVDGTNWVYIPSGNEDRDNLILGSTDAEIKLMSTMNDSTGSVKFVSANDSLVVDGATANQISIGMVWGSF